MLIRDVIQRSMGMIVATGGPGGKSGEADDLADQANRSTFSPRFFGPRMTDGETLGLERSPSRTSFEHVFALVRRRVMRQLDTGVIREARVAGHVHS